MSSDSEEERLSKKIRLDQHLAFITGSTSSTPTSQESAVDKKSSVPDRSLKRKLSKCKTPAVPNMKPDGPKSRTGAFMWALHFVALAASILGHGELLWKCHRLVVNLSTSFSGMGCPEIALSMICAALAGCFESHGSQGLRFVKPVINVLVALDVEKHCRHILAHHDPQHLR